MANKDKPGKRATAQLTAASMQPVVDPLTAAIKEALAVLENNDKIDPFARKEAREILRRTVSAWR